MPDVILLNANAERIPLADNVVHAVVTSPPYYGLRKYSGVDETQEIGLEDMPELYLERMVAVFREVKRVLRPDGCVFVNMGDSYAGSGGAHTFDHANPGLSKSAERDGLAHYRQDGGRGPEKIGDGLKPLDLMNIPARLVLALQADGWYHRSTIIWSKLNPMPESVNGWRWEQCRVKMGNRGRGTEAWRANANIKGSQQDHDKDGSFLQDATWSDCPGCEKCSPNGGLVLRRGSWRPTTSHEYIFMMTKTDRYFADGEAVREEHLEPWRGKGEKERINYNTGGIIGRGRVGEYSDGIRQYNPAGRNVRSVWTFSTQPYPGSHFATFPEELPRRCLKASTSERGCCPKCGAAWARVVESKQTGDMRWSENGGLHRANVPDMEVSPSSVFRTGSWNINTTLGWLPTCDCPPHDPAPMTILDPFAGSGTTGVVARELGHHFIGLDLSFAYLNEQARSRLELDRLAEWTEGGTPAHDLGAGKKDGKGSLADLPLFGEAIMEKP